MDTLSVSAETEFTEIWYEVAAEDHFWVKHRFEILMREIAALGLDTRAPLLGLDIGCGHGAVLRQFSRRTAWAVDGCDLNREALRRASEHNEGKVLYYNIHDRRPEMRERYDFVLMLDVIEHIGDTTRFIASAAHHLRPGGYAFVNVPALQGLYSKYDVVTGHLRRYDKSLLREHLNEGGLEVRRLRYWGLTLIPLALIRKLIVQRMTVAEDIVRKGMQPPSSLVSSLLSGMLSFEAFVMRKPPIGASLLAIAQRPEN
jgi:2-polyprenyl-3-methyl-5-hydroxy-6-metoxy-1,4-benzoquinol methylase